MLRHVASPNPAWCTLAGIGVGAHGLLLGQLADRHQLWNRCGRRVRSPGYGHNSQWRCSGHGGTRHGRRVGWRRARAAIWARAGWTARPTTAGPIDNRRGTGRNGVLDSSLPTTEPPVARGCGVKAGRHRNAGRLRQLSAEFSGPRGGSRAHVPDLSEPVAAGAGRRRRPPPIQNLVEWSGGALDDLVAYLSGPATAVRIEVLPATGDTAVGEVHLLAGGISETLFAGKSTDDALDKLRGVNNPRFRLEPRLPNPVDGDLGSPGPDSGTLDSRPLAHLMRYCEQYVITCGIEVWRGSENRARRVPQRRDQRRHRGRHRRARAAGRGDAVGVGQLPADHAQAHAARVGAQGRRRQAGRPAPAPRPRPRAAAAPPARPPATPPAARPPATPPTARPAAPAARAPARARLRRARPRRRPRRRTRRARSSVCPRWTLAGLKAGEAAAAVARQTAAPVGQAPRDR